MLFIQQSDHFLPTSIGKIFETNFRLRVKFYAVFVKRSEVGSG